MAVLSNDRKPPTGVRPGRATWFRRFAGRFSVGDNRPKSGRFTPYLFILPGFIFYGAFVLVPIGATVRLSFMKWNGLLPAVWVGFENYAKLITDPHTWAAFRVSATFIFFACVLPVLAALLLTGGIARAKIRGLSAFRVLYFLPYTIAHAVVAIAWRWLYATDGSINQLVGLIFGKDARVAVLGDFKLALPALGLVSFWMLFGFVTVMLLSGTQHIPHELYEAARVDGAGPIREFFAVTLPGVRHELRVSLVMTFITAIRMFDLPLVANAGGPGYQSTTPALMMYRAVFVNGDIGRGAALAILITIVVAIGVIAINKILAQED